MFTIQASTCIIDNLFSKNKSIIVAFVCEIIKKIVRQKVMKTCRFMGILFVLFDLFVFFLSLSLSLLHTALSSTKDDGARARARERVESQ